MSKSIGLLVVAVALFSILFVRAARAVSPNSIELVSVSRDGQLANDQSSQWLDVTADGRYVAFSSFASNLVEDDTNGQPDIFVRDLVANTIERVSIASSGIEGNGYCAMPSISDDGRYVVFSSTSTNLVPDITNGYENVYIHDRVEGTTRLVIQANLGAGSPTISGNGRFVAFNSSSTDLVPDDTNHRADTFVYDLVDQTIELVSRSASGSAVGDVSFFPPGISYDGRYVAFSTTRQIIGQDTNGKSDAYVFDRLTRTVELASLGDRGQLGDNGGLLRALSADGTAAVFQSVSTNLVQNDHNGLADVFIRRLDAEETVRVSVASTGVEGNGSSAYGSVSADSRFVAFYSLASNLVPGDSNNVGDVFVHDLETGLTTRASINGAGVEGNGSSVSPTISAQSLLVAFSSTASNLVPNDTNNYEDVFVYQYQPVVNTPPTADAGTNQTGFEGEPVTFDGTLSADSDGSIVNYSWDFGDGYTGTGAIASHVFPDNGLYEVVLTVTDNLRGTSSDAIEVTVENLAPEASLGTLEGSPSEGDSVTFSFSNADDVAADISAGFLHSYDCNSDSEFDVVDSPLPSFSCEYRDSGDFQVTGRISDKDGGTSEYVVGLSVNNIAPTAHFAFDSNVTLEGQSNVFSFEEISEPSLDDWGAGFLFSYDCDNDGVFDVDMSPETSFSCLYPDSGVFAARGRITDKDGGYSEYLAAPPLGQPQSESLVWSTASLSQDRQQLAAASAGSKALFGGGSRISSSGSYNIQQNRVDIYDNVTNTWTTGSLSEARANLAAAGVGHKVLFAGGIAGATAPYYSERVDIYDVETGVWTMASLSLARREMGATSVGSKALFAGGGDFTPRNVVDIYDVTTESWSTARLSMPRSEIAATSVGSQALFAGGAINVSPGRTSRVDIYDDEYGTWSTAELSQPRRNAAATTVGTKAIFAGGGLGSSQYSDVVDIYDAATGTWSTARLSQPRSHLVATTVGTKAIFAGGFTTNQAKSDVVDIYDDATGTWTTAKLSLARTQFAATSVGNRALFAGGQVGYPNSEVGQVDIALDIPIRTFLVENVAPSAELIAMGPVVVNSPVTISFINQEDPSSVDRAAGFRFAFDFNNDGFFEIGDGTYDGSVPEDFAEVAADYLPEPGNFTVAARIIDKDGGYSDYSLDLTVQPSNNPPTVSISGPYVLNEGSSTELTALASDPDGDVLTYTWDLDNDGMFETSGQTAILSANALDGPGDTLTVSVQVADESGLSASDSATIDVLNVAPTAILALSSPTVHEGSTVNLNLTNPYDPSQADMLAGFAFSFDCGTGFVASSGPDFSCFFDDQGSYIVWGRISDKDGGYSEYAVTVIVDNVAPVAEFSASSPTLNEGGTTTLYFGEEYDPSAIDTAAGFTYSLDCEGDGIDEVIDSSVNSYTCSYRDDGVYQASGKITDKDEGISIYSLAVTVINAAPVVSEVVAPIDPVVINTLVEASASFTDAGILDTHTASWDWSDGITSKGVVVEADGSGSVTGSHSYAEPGVYVITLTVMDDDGGAATKTFQYVVVFDPEGGFVTGGGWINSPAGAYVAQPDLTGKANFGFVSKYKKGTTVPTGNTEFQFKAGDLNFRSDSYDWLVVAGAKAMFKGIGTINGSGNYGFMISAIDEDQTASTETDLFRIKIWDKSNGDTVVYDNQLGANDDADPTTAIGGGNIIVHKSK